MAFSCPRCGGRIWEPSRCHGCGYLLKAGVVAAGIGLSVAVPTVWRVVHVGPSPSELKEIILVMPEDRASPQKTHEEPPRQPQWPPYTVTVSGSPARTKVRAT